MRSIHAIDRRKDTQLDTLCQVLVQELSKIAAQREGHAAVVELFNRQPRNTEARKELLRQAFWRLDERPSWYGNGSHCQDWHAVLRQTRNSLEHGPAMFAAWSDD